MLTDLDDAMVCQNKKKKKECLFLFSDWQIEHQDRVTGSPDIQNGWIGEE